MVRVLFAVLSALVVLCLSAPAMAGDYYEGGYRDRNYDRGYDRPYRSSNCCYRRVVHYERTYRDHHNHYERPYYRRSYHSASYYDRPYRSSGYYNGSYSGGSYYSGYSGGSHYGTSYSGNGTSYSNGRPYSYDSQYSGGGYITTNYDQPRNFYAPGCQPTRYKVYDDAGGWVWGKTAVCY